VVTFSFHPTPSRDLRFLELGDGNYAGDRLLDHVDDHGFDFTAWRFRPLFFFREAPFTARLGLALVTLRFVPPLRPDFEALRALARAAEVLLRSFARLLGCAFARFFRLAMISSQPLCTAVA
jgi:hypothetical protein